jgi:hypothetical protein
MLAPKDPSSFAAKEDERLPCADDSFALRYQRCECLCSKAIPRTKGSSGLPLIAAELARRSNNRRAKLGQPRAKANQFR